jgi:hypothetical protein
MKFTLVGGSEKNLIFEGRSNGSGSFMLLDTGPDDKPMPSAQPAARSQTSDNASISGEVELPLGTCCRETGTLIFKAKLNSSDAVSENSSSLRTSRKRKVLISFVRRLALSLPHAYPMVNGASDTPQD